MHRRRLAGRKNPGACGMKAGFSAKSPLYLLASREPGSELSLTARGSAFLFLLALLFVAPPAFCGGTFFLRDLFFDFVPQRRLAGIAYGTGELPLWNPYAGFGKPFAADPATAAFYPLHVFFYVLPPAWAVNIYCVLHLWLTGTGMLLIARHWDLKIFPALVTAAAAMFSTLVVSSLEFGLNCVTIAWAPFIFRAASGLAEESGRISGRVWTPGFVKSMATLGLFFVIQYLGGYPEFVAYTVVLAFTYGIAFAWCTSGLAAVTRFGLAFGAAGCLAILFVMPQLLLAFELIGQGERSQGVDPGYRMASLCLGHLWGLVLPFIHGRPGYPDTWWGGSVYEFWVGTAYVGILPVTLVCMLPWTWRRGVASGFSSSAGFRCTFLAVAAVFGIVMAFGDNTPLHPLLHKFVPGFRFFRFPGKFLALFVFAGSLLAGFGYQAVRGCVQQSPKLVARLSVACGIWCVLLACCAIATIPFPRAVFELLIGNVSPDRPAAIAVQQQDIWLSLLFSILAAAVFAAMCRLPTPVIDYLAVALVVVNLFVMDWCLYGIVDAAAYEEPPAIDAQDLERGKTRAHSQYGDLQQWFYGRDNPQLAHWAMKVGVGDTWLPFGIRKTWQGGMKLRRYLVLSGLFQGLPPEPAARIADICSIGRVIGGEKAEDILWRNGDRQYRVADRPTALPRAFLVGSWRIESDERRTVEYLLDDDPRETAVVEVPEGWDVPYAHLPETRPLQRKVEWIEDRAHRQKLKIVSNEPALLVVNDAWYPGWQVRVDGQQHFLYRVNYDFRGVFVGSGEHAVEFTYEPPQFQNALFCTAAVTVVAVALLVWTHFRRSGDVNEPAH